MDSNSTMINGTDNDLFADSQPMNDEELSRLHESTLQMFRSNKIGPKNAFDIVLIDYLPAIFEASSFDDDHMNNFQSVGTTLETSAKIYAARIDSLYSETRKAQSILRSTNDTVHRTFDDDDDETENETNGERRISNNKKIRLMMKRKKTIVNDRQKLLRKSRYDELRPIMINQFFLSAMHNDSMMLSELYEKISSTSNTLEKKKLLKAEPNDILSSTDFICDPLFVDTTNGSIGSNDLEPSPSSDLTSIARSNQLLLTPNSQISSTTTNLDGTPIRSRADSLNSTSSILTHAVHLLNDSSDEYSHLDSSKVNAFINETHQSTASIDDVIPSPTKPNRKRRLSLEYPFPFLVEQAKKQRMTPKKLRELSQTPMLPERAPSPEYCFPPPAQPLSQSNESIISISKRQRAFDFRHLQTKMHQILIKNFEINDHLTFSELFDDLHLDDHRQSSADIGISFAALLNNAVRYQLVLNGNDLRDDLSISPLPKL